MATKRLGRGLEALIHGDEKSSSNKPGVIEIPIKDIVPNPLQPRKDGLDKKSLQDLIASIKRRGIITPITVKDDNGKFTLIAGERRFRASKLAGLKAIPSYIVSISNESELMEIALIENIQRENLNPIDEAEGYALLQSKFNYSHDSIANAVGKKRVTISNSLRLLKLPRNIIRSLRNQTISAGHGRAILMMNSIASMNKLYNLIIAEKLSVRASEAIAKGKSTTKVKTASKKSKKTNSSSKNLEDELITILGTKVQIHYSKNGGDIEIHFFSDDDLERILDLLRSIR
ncbi:MAG: ParB/RepB/Spo0J family partition protein [Candidatus Neomarinimicrobiota bacterium]|nr:ParB/RepB/Spo0J family partition protein [Candidatus Neomarinimicrobiota bacterium]MED5266041.1 ParB/RepB/Spo0J family partition protein [Candidatus Neomarinimicrobiota bacterium]